MKDFVTASILLRYPSLLLDEARVTKFTIVSILHRSVSRRFSIGTLASALTDTATNKIRGAFS